MLRVRLYFWGRVWILVNRSLTKLNDRLPLTNSNIIIQKHSVNFLNTSSTLSITSNVNIHTRWDVIDTSSTQDAQPRYFSGELSCISLPLTSALQLVSQGTLLLSWRLSSPKEMHLHGFHAGPLRGRHDCHRTTKARGIKNRPFR